MRNLFIKIGRFTVVLAILVSVGAHWAVMQSVAWTQMIVERSGESSFSDAVKTTFDGEHPCALCLRITEQTQKEKQPEQVQLKVKPDVIFEPTAIAFHALSNPLPPQHARPIPESRSEAPAIPPPRRA